MEKLIIVFCIGYFFVRSIIILVLLKECDVLDEGGLSVWDCIYSDGMYFPILPEDANENAVSDYFRLLFSDKSVYLVTGTLMRLEGADREPLLYNPVIIKELPKYKVL